MELFTIKSPCEGLYKEKGSKFISLAYPVADESEAKDIVKAIRKKYHDARHKCYAFRLGDKAEKVRTADDGEPPHSAGSQILGRLASLSLTNVLLVVVRYFGGTKLGLPGLIRAYRTAAEEALGKAEIIVFEAT